MTPLGLLVLSSLLSGLVAALVAAELVRPTRRLAPRVRPYTLAARTSLGRSADVLAVARPDSVLSAGTIGRLFGPLVSAAATRLSQAVDAGGEERLLLKLRQARMLTDVPEERRAQEYRVRQLASAVAFTTVAVVLGWLLHARAGALLLLAAFGFMGGVAHWRGKVDRAIEDRRTRMNIELYTINQLLAMNARVGGGVIQAVQRVVQRGSGEVVEELSEALVAHETGLRASEAFTRAAQLTPDANAARTYKLLAAGAEWGADLAEGLLVLSDDVRDARREALRRSATRRRAAMLVPIIAILAPVMLLFVGAPLVDIVLKPLN